MSSPEPDAFAAAVRAAITARGLSLDRLRYHLAQRGHELSVATLSYWQSGRSRPERATSLAALAVLEDVLGVPPGELAALLPARRRMAPPSAVAIEAVQRLVAPDSPEPYDLAALDVGAGLTRLSVHDRFVLGPERRLVERHVVELLSAREDGTREVPRTHRLPEGTTVRVAAVRNCSLEGVVRSPEVGLLVARLALPRALKAGETIVVGYRLEYSGGEGVTPGVDRLFGDAVPSAHLEVDFAPDALPLRAERVTVVDGVDRAQPAVLAGPTLHALVRDFGPGAHGLRWSW